MSPTPAMQATETLVQAHAVELKLPTVGRRFKQLADEAVREQQTPIGYLAALLEAEVCDRAERRIPRHLAAATLPQHKTLDAFVFADNPKVPQATIAQLAQCDWVTRA